MYFLEFVFVVKWYYDCLRLGRVYVIVRYSGKNFYYIGCGVEFLKTYCFIWVFYFDLVFEVIFFKIRIKIVVVY